MWPQITIIAVFSMGLGINLINHGKPANINYNFFTKLIIIGLYMWILNSGGFFNNIK